MEKQQTAVALGFFDGVHQGHRRVIEKAVSLANGHLIPAVFTFTMHEGGPSKKQGAGDITTLEQKIRDAFDEKIRRMYQSELGTATEKYQIKVDEINDRASRADIHTSLIANGIIEIKRG